MYKHKHKHNTYIYPPETPLHLLCRASGDRSRAEEERTSDGRGQGRRVSIVAPSKPVRPRFASQQSLSPETTEYFSLVGGTVVVGGVGVDSKHCTPQSQEHVYDAHTGVWLLALGCPAFSANTDGDTPLLLALRAKNVPLSILLARAGDNPSVITQQYNDKIT